MKGVGLSAVWQVYGNAMAAMQWFQVPVSDTACGCIGRCCIIHMAGCLNLPVCCGFLAGGYGGVLFVMFLSGIRVFGHVPSLACML